MLISVRHITRYTYEAPARYGIQTLRLTPQSFKGQRVLDWSVTAPGMDKALRFMDGYGNEAALVATDILHTQIEIVAAGHVETTDCAGVVEGLRDPAPARVYLRQTAQTHADDAIREMAASLTGTTQLDRMHTLMDIIRDRIDYQTGTTSPQSSAADALAQGTGVCQDHAHVFISAARSLGIPARYVNGYFLTGANAPEPAHHAWAEVLVEHLGWVGFDAANRVCPDDRFIRLATGLDAVTASPIRGRRPLPFGETEANEQLDVIVEVQQQQQQNAQQ